MQTYPPRLDNDPKEADCSRQGSWYGFWLMLTCLAARRTHPSSEVDAREAMPPLRSRSVAVGVGIIGPRAVIAAIDWGVWLLDSVALREHALGVRDIVSALQASGGILRPAGADRTASEQAGAG